VFFFLFEKAILLLLFIWKKYSLYHGKEDIMKLPERQKMKKEGKTT
jgi:hypothetical protein